MFQSRRALIRTIERERERHARREDELLNRLMFMAGKEWGPPPRPAFVPQEDEPVHEFDVEQQPD